MSFVPAYYDTPIRANSLVGGLLANVDLHAAPLLSVFSQVGFRLELSRENESSWPNEPRPCILGLKTITSRQIQMNVYGFPRQDLCSGLAKPLVPPRENESLQSNERQPCILDS